MFYLRILVFSVAVGVVYCDLKFPPGFKFGAATAAYQVEGSWNVSDKSPNVWDTFVHNNPEAIIDNSTGDIACDSYNQWRRDVEIASELGLHFYRLSIAWTRLLPNGFSNTISEDGKKYYNNLIDALLEKGIEPVITLYHWDLPQSLQNLGGWANPLVSDWFASYARIAFSLFGDRVKTWVTLNEPIVFCEVVYNIGIIAPGIKSPGIGNYLCNKHAMLAHAKAWRIYDEEFRHQFHGKVSITNHFMWMEAEDESQEGAAELTRQLWAMYCHPIFSKEGGWHPAIEKSIEDKSKKEGWPRSRLPEFTREEKDLVKGTYDFFGFNYYTARTVHAAKEAEEIGPWPFVGAPDLDIAMSVHPTWTPTVSFWFYVYPEGIRKQLVWLKQQYGDIEFLITENGFAGHDTHLDDQDRILYYKQHLEQVLLAIKEGVNITGYTAWTLMDNFEWQDGYQSKFGLYEVDFSDPARTRRPRRSAAFYASVIKKHSLNIENKQSDELYYIVFFNPVAPKPLYAIHV